MKNPRWINEIPKPIPINERVEITDEMKKEAEEFRDLTLYAMKLNYGENQTVIRVIIEEL